MKQILTWLGALTAWLLRSCKTEVLLQTQLPDCLAVPSHECKWLMQALNVLSQAGILKGEARVRLLTNRAACLLALHQPLRALQDCQHAVQVSV